MRGEWAQVVKGWANIRFFGILFYCTTVVSSLVLEYYYYSSLQSFFVYFFEENISSEYWCTYTRAFFKNKLYAPYLN
jgi:hypothetical protein